MECSRFLHCTVQHLCQTASASCCLPTCCIVGNWDRWVISLRSPFFPVNYINNLVSLWCSYGLKTAAAVCPLSSACDLTQSPHLNTAGCTICRHLKTYLAINQYRYFPPQTYLPWLHSFLCCVIKIQYYIILNGLCQFGLLHNSDATKGE